MSLGRLLAAGKSLVGLSGGAGRYREDKRARLPKFISPKNPFAPGEAPAQSAAPAAQPEAPKAVVAVARADASEAGKEFARAPMSARAIGWFGNWGQKLKPLSQRLRMPGPARLAAPRAAGATVQGELSLDAIRVVRNDLSDTDLDIVQRADAKPVSPLMAMTAKKLEPVGAAWDRLTNRFFDVDQT